MGPIGTIEMALPPRALPRREAEALIASASDVLGYLAENVATARTFCPGLDIAVAASVVGVETARIRRELATGVQSVMVLEEAVVAAHALSQCAIAVTRHLDLVTHLALVGATLSTIGGTILKMPLVTYGGIGLSVAVQLFGPAMRIPLFE